MSKVVPVRAAGWFLWCVVTSACGEGEQVDRCGGEPLPCSALDDSYECRAQRGCEDMSWCGGVARACSSFATGDECRSQGGCGWLFVRCVDPPDVCAGIADPDACWDEPYCWWSDTLGRCTSSPAECGGLDVFDCLLEDRCVMEDSCQDVAAACEAMRDPETCGRRSGCTWVTAQCAGEPEGCSGFSVGTCFAQVGCAVAEGGSWRNAPPLEIGGPGFGAMTPTIAGADGGFAMAWLEEAEGTTHIRFALIDARGRMSGPAGYPAGSEGPPYRPQLFRSPSGFGLAWSFGYGGDSIHFALLDAIGAPVGEDVAVITGTHVFESATPVPAGDGYGLAWGGWPDEPSGPASPFFARLDAVGHVVGAAVQLQVPDRDCSVPSLAWTGSEFGAAWYGSVSGAAGIYFRRLDAGGGPLGDAALVPIGAWNRYSPLLAWDGTAYGLLVQRRESYYELGSAFIRLDGSGTPLGDEHPIESILSPDTFLWTGAGYAILGTAPATSPESEPAGRVLACVDQYGWPIGSAVAVPGITDASTWPDLAVSDAGLGVVWAQHVVSDDETVHFTRVDCP